MKIIIPMAGVGSRLRPHTLTIPKPLTVIAGKTIVERLLEEIKTVVGQQVTDIGFIIGPVTKGFPESTSDDLKAIAESLGATGHVFVQQDALGTAHAIHQARMLLDGPVVVAFADTIFKADFTLDNTYDGVIWVKKIDNPEKFGVVKLSDGVITDFIEKPTEFVSDLAIIGIYYFKEGQHLQQEIDHLIDHNITGKGGEYQLTDALENMRIKGLKFVPGTVNDWMDSGFREATIETNQKVLMYEMQAGKSLVSETVKSENSQIIPPCYIGENVVLQDSKVGPYVSVGEGTTIINSTVSNSMIQNKSVIQHANIKDSMIGNNVKYDGRFTSVSLGDFSELTLDE
ncbi:MAG: nucleotidyltransferase [Flavobacteriales bacterium]|nr:MAG: nucleotidyltransferase [Flavobacteriales bacterium]